MTTKNMDMEEQLYTTPVKSLWLVFPAKVLSYLFHPLFIPTYFFLYLVYRFPYLFTDISVYQLKLKVFSTFWMTAFFPAFAVFLLYKLKFVSSIYLRTAKERIAPYMITMFFYWWMYYLSKNMTNQPEALQFFYFGIFISTSIGLVINNLIKISLHGISMGSLLAAMILLSFFYQTPMGMAISITALITGMVATSRLIVSDHTTQEVYAGLILGIACQLIGYFFAM